MGKYKLIKGNIWNGCQSNDPQPEALLICDDIIVASGDAKDLKKMVSNLSALQEYDFNSQTVLPGISDSHIHLLSYSKWKTRVDLSAANSFKEAIDMLLKEKEKLSSGSWINGVNYDETNWEDNNRPTKSDLDKYFPNNPVLLDKADGHKHLANTLALKISGVDQIESPHILRDENGECNGILNEAAASPLLELISKECETPEKLKKGLKAACNTLTEHGVTSIHDCDVDEYGLGMKLNLYQELLDNNELSVRVQSYHDKMPSFSFTTGYGNDMLYYAGFKLFADGATTARTAAMSEPYSDEPSTCGVLNDSDE